MWNAVSTTWLQAAPSDVSYHHNESGDHLYVIHKKGVLASEVFYLVQGAMDVEAKTIRGSKHMLRASVDTDEQHSNLRSGRSIFYLQASCRYIGFEKCS